VQFLANLQANKNFKTVDLGQVGSSDVNPSQTIFSIDITY
jgi:hypothetical protein